MPRSWWEPKALCAVINWNDDAVRNPLFNTKPHHMVYFNISPYHITLLLTPSVTSSLSGRMTDLFSAFSLICLCFPLPHLGCAVQHIAHPIHASHRSCLQTVDSGSPFALSASAATWFLLPKHLYLSKASKSHLDKPMSHIMKSRGSFPSWPASTHRILHVIL